MVSYAIIENNRIVNRIVADEQFMQSLNVAYTNDPAAQIGCERVNGQWVMPDSVPAPEPVKDELTKLKEDFDSFKQLVKERVGISDEDIEQVEVRKR